MYSFAFESYGVRVSIESNRKRIISRVRTIATRSLLGNLRSIDPGLADHVFIIRKISNTMNLELDGEDLGGNEFTKGFYHYFESRLRVLVAEYAKDLVFVHAGAVAWKGKAVLFPADSFQGKTTLVAALVKRGAVYYSDDYAILDSDGFLHPFARPLSIREQGRAEIRSNRNVSSLGGIAGVEPLRVDAVIITHFEENARWDPKILTPGNGLMKMIPQTIPVRSNPEFSTNVLKTIASRAIIAESVRCDVKLCINDVIVFIDKILL